MASGVLFTVNPINGKTDEMVVNATWGLGEALVAGQVTPDTLVVDKASGKIRQVDIGDKKVMTAATAEGTVEIEVAQEQRVRQSVSADQVAELARLALSIELHFGTPQDIEWAIADGTAHILQSRPNVPSERRQPDSHKRSSGSFAAASFSAASSERNGWCDFGTTVSTIS